MLSTDCNSSMKKLITSFIHDNYKAGKKSGSFYGSVLSIDITGFTALTEHLFKKGTEGAELLSDIINTVFEETIEAVYKENGFITTFAGDAFTAIFPDDDPAAGRAIRAAGRMNGYIISLKPFAAGRRKVKITARIGIASGKVKWNIFCGKRQCVPLFSGKPIQEAALLQSKAIPGTIGFGPPGKTLEVKSKERKITKIRGSSRALTAEILKKFIPDPILFFSSPGEFKNITSVFIAVDHERYEISRFISFVSDLAIKHGGILNMAEFGDKGAVCLVIFGAPLAIEKHSVKALDFAFELKNNFPGNRIGIAEGTVFSGFIGNPKYREEYTSLGSVVNLSARIAVGAEPGKLIIDGRTAASVSDEYKITAGREIKYKGIDRPVTVHEALSKKSRASHKAGTYFGRKKEISALKTFIDDIAGGKRAGLRIIAGPAGMGKSSLAEKIITYAEKTLNSILMFKGNEFRDSELYGIADFLMKAIGLREDMTLNEKQTLFEKNFPRFTGRAFGGGKVPASVKKNKLFIADLLGIPPSSLQASAISPFAKHRIILSVLTEIFAAFAEKGKCLFVIDDAQWLDTGTKNLFESVLSVAQGHLPSFLIMTREKAQREFFRTKRDMTTGTIDLECLGPEDIRGHAGSLISGEPSKELYGFIAKRSGGNPFYIEQICEYLKENGLLKNVNGKTSMIKKDTMIPAGISDLIISRIDKLETEVRRGVVDASVLGLEFSLKVLSEMLRMRNIKSLLAGGENENIWRPASELNYIFHHALIKDAVYGTQLKKTLRSLHLLAGKAMEKVHRGNTAPIAAILAHHFSVADLKEKTLHYLFDAAIYAKSNYWNDSAMKYFDECMKYTDDPERMMCILHNKGEILVSMARYAEATEIYSNAFKIAERSGNNIYLGKLSNGLGDIAWRRGDFKKAQKYLDSSFKYFKSGKDRSGEASVNGTFGNIELSRGNLKQAMANYKKWSDYAKGNDLPMYIKALNNIGIVHTRMGAYDKAKECLTETLRLAEQTKNRHMQSYAYGNIGVIYYHKGLMRDALKYFKLWLDLSREIYEYSSQLTVLGNLGTVYNNLRRFKTALKYHTRQYDLALKVGNMESQAMALGNIGVIEWQQGKLRSAREYYQKQIELSEKHGFTNMYGRALGNLGLVLSDLEDHASAEKCYLKKLEINREQNNRGSEALTCCFLGNLYRKTGKTEKALEFFDKAIGINTEIGATAPLGDSYKDLAKVYKKQGDLEKMRECILKAIDVLEKANISEKLFEPLVMKYELEYKEDPRRSEANLKNMLKKYKKNTEKGMIYHRLFLLTKKRVYGEKALDIFLVIIKTREEKEYLKTISEIKAKLKKYRT